VRPRRHPEEAAIPKEKESRYAAKLRELGFVPSTEGLTPEEARQTDQTFEEKVGKPARIPRAQRREYTAKKLIPGFVFGEDFTAVLDELGFNWNAKGHIDLTHLGFHNGIKDYVGILIPINRTLN
jgi:hypothetical protein